MTTPPPEPPFAPSDFTNVLPVQYSTQIIQEATHQSAALQLGTRVPMGTRMAKMPIPGTFPKAAWATAAYGSRKPYTTVSLDQMEIVAEEIAAVIAIPDAMVDDSDINLWAYCRPRLAEAFAVAIDQAIFFGIGAPATFPAGGLAGSAQVATDGRDVVDTINNAMSLVEVQGLNVTGQAADIGVRGLLRGVRDDNGALLLGTTQAETGPISTIYGVPAQFVPLDVNGDWNYVTGAFQNLLIGVRQDIRYEMSRDAVLVDDAGTVIINAFQDNVTILKAWGRFGCAIVRPVTVRVPDGAIPFAVATLDHAIPALPGGGTTTPEPGSAGVSPASSGGGAAPRPSGGAGAGGNSSAPRGGRSSS